MQISRKVDAAKFKVKGKKLVGLTTVVWICGSGNRN